jgi:hypothetical protein
MELIQTGGSRTCDLTTTSLPDKPAEAVLIFDHQEVGL